MSEISRKDYYPFLDGFRAIAILWVMLHHAYPFLPTLEDTVVGGKLMGRICQLGFFGVDIFFVISGFLITGLLIDDLKNKIRMKRFYTRRFFKIVPQYLLFVLCGLLILPFIAPDEKFSKISLASYFLFFQNYAPPISTLGHLWSITIEEHFYLFYALLLWFICQITSDSKKRYVLLFIILVVLVVGGNLLRAYLFNLHPPPYKPPLLFQQTHMRFDALIFGCLIKLAEPFWVSIPQRIQFVLKYAMVILGITPFIYLYVYYSKYTWMAYTLLYMGTGFLVLSALLKQKLVCSVTEFEPMRWIGRNSYGIYLWHYPVARTIVHFQDKIFDFMHSRGILNPNDMTVLVILYLATAVGLGALTTATVEKYFLSLRQKVAP